MHLLCCLLSPSMAASRRALNWFSCFLLLLMVVSMPVVHTYRTGFPGRRTVAEQRVTVAQELERSLLTKGSFGNGGAIFNVEQREVPTGPDPLHHNNNPTGP